MAYQRAVIKDHFRIDVPIAGIITAVVPALVKNRHGLMQES